MWSEGGCEGQSRLENAQKSEVRRAKKTSETLESNRELPLGYLESFHVAEEPIPFPCGVP
jgi:hypothetical protein